MKNRKILDAISGHRQLFSYHPRYGYTFHKNMRSRYLSPDQDLGGYYVETDANGFRNSASQSIDATTSGDKLLLLGCSFAAGHGVSNEHRFSDILSTKVKGVMIYNAALSGTGMDQQYLILKDLLQDGEFHTVLFSPYSGCAYRNSLQERTFYDPFLGRECSRPKPYFEIQNGDFVLKNSPVPHWGQGVESAPVPILKTKNVQRLQRFVTYIALVYGGIDTSPLADCYSGKDIKCHELLIGVLDMIKQECADKNVNLVMAPLPSRKDLLNKNAPPYVTFFESYCIDNAIKFMNVYDHFKEQFKLGTEKLFIDADEHYTPRGHEIVADYFSNRLAEE